MTPELDTKLFEEVINEIFPGLTMYVRDVNLPPAFASKIFASSIIGVFKGKNLPGHMGMETVTIQNLEVVKVDLDKNVILVKGSVPGNKYSVLKIRSSVKASK